MGRSLISRVAEHRLAGFVAAALAVSAWGAGSVLAKVIEVESSAIAVYRFAMSGLAFAVFLQIRRTPLSWRVMKASAAGGIALGLDVALFFAAIKLTTVVNATVIGTLQPIVILFIVGPLFGDRVKPLQIGLATVAIAGTIVVVTANTGTPEWSGAGDLLALGAVFMWAAYFVFSKRSKGVITSNEYTTGTALWTALVNLPIALIFGQDLSIPSSRDIFWLVVMSIVAGVFGHALMNWSLVRVPLWIGSVLTLLIPVASSTMAWFVLDERLVPVQWLAMAVVIGALAMILRDQAKGTGPSPVAVLVPTVETSDGEHETSVGEQRI